MTNYDLNKIAAQFDTYQAISPYGDGHINDTYLAQAKENYILQRINRDVFHHPDQVMHNIVLVTEHIRKKRRAQGSDDPRAVLHVINTLDGKPYYKTKQGDYFRMYSFIERASSYSEKPSPAVFYNAAKGFGRFFSLLSDFDPSLLYETIPAFHHTPARYEAVMEAAAQDRCQRAKQVRAELGFVRAHKEDTAVVTDLLGTAEVPLRVTHNDTKLNNIMLDDETGAPICVIDLDTVMPGSILYDFGDSIRFGASSAAEDEQDLDKVYCDMALYEAFTKGFLEETATFLTQKEKQLLPFSARLLTLECGMRFLTDYLNGDTYFKTHYEGQNLDRARTQFKLVADMEQKKAQMVQITQDCLAKSSRNASSCA